MASPLAAWRDLDRAHRHAGLVVSATGLTLHAGRRVYRLRWAWRRG